MTCTDDEMLGNGTTKTLGRDFKQEILSQWPRHHPQTESIRLIVIDWIAETGADRTEREKLALAMEAERLLWTLDGELAGGEQFGNRIQWELKNRRFNV